MPAEFYTLIGAHLRAAFLLLSFLAAWCAFVFVLTFACAAALILTNQ